MLINFGLTRIRSRIPFEDFILVNSHYSRSPYLLYHLVSGRVSSLCKNCIFSNKICCQLFKLSASILKGFHPRVVYTDRYQTPELEITSEVEIEVFNAFEQFHWPCISSSENSYFVNKCLYA